MVSLSILIYSLLCSISPVAAKVWYGIMNNYNFYFFVLNISCSSYIVNVKIQNFHSQYFVTNESWKKGKFYTDYTRLLVDLWFVVSWRYSLLKTGADNYTRSIHASREGPDETLMLCTPDMRCIESEFWLTSQVCNCHWCLQCHRSHNNRTYCKVTCHKITSVKSYEEICAA